jgi:hypothetical protein
MSARNRALAAVLACLTTAPATAQVVSSAPLRQVDPWGVGWLGRADGALSADLWANTDGETLAPLMAAIQPASLSSAARDALRRVMLSSARGPEGGADLIAERLRLIEQLGETRRSIDMRQRFPDTDWGKAGARIASEFDLAGGQTKDGCARVSEVRADQTDWMPLRALCLALAGDFDAAGMVSEQAGSGNAWLMAAIETMREPTRTQPEGRYGSAFEAAVSVSAKLSAPADAFKTMPADLAAAILFHPAATPQQKRAALPAALAGGKAMPADAMTVLAAKAEAPPAARRTAATPDFLVLALEAVGQDGAAPAQATAYAAALKAAENASGFRLAANALIEPVRKLPLSEETLPHAETFARTALFMGDTKLAASWRKLMSEAPADKTDAWAAARLDLMLALKGQEADKAADHIAAMIAAVPAPPEGAAPRNPTPAQKQADLRRIENARVLFLAAGTSRTLSPSTRAMLAKQRSAGRGVPDAVLASIGAAIDSKAQGEALLAAIGQLSGDMSATSFAGLSDLLGLLRRAGFEKEADALFLEALQPWQAL